MSKNRDRVVKRVKSRVRDDEATADSEARKARRTARQKSLRLYTAQTSLYADAMLGFPV